MNKLKRGDYLKILTAVVLLSAVLLMSMFLSASITTPRMGAVIRENPLSYLCAGLLVLFLIGVFFVCMYYIDGSIIRSFKKMVMISSILFISFLLNLIVGGTVNVYLRPYAFAALLVTILYNKNMGIFASFVMVLLTMFYDIIQGEFGFTADHFGAMLLGIVSSMFACVSCEAKGVRFRSVLSGILIALPSGASAVLSEVMFASGGEEILRSGIYAVTSPIFAVMLYMIFLPLFEKVFNVVTNYRLYELTDPSAPLLRELKERCPGTFNHSMVVANLAEACAYRIGVSPQLVRAAAYYHDVGKMLHPEYFVENQGGGANPHDDLTPEMSTSIIKRHGINGYELCLEHNIPFEIANVCREHHGTLPIYYFYKKAQKFTDGTLNIDKFRYDGPKPQTKVSAIVMIADACEAAIRASESKDIDKIEEIVRQIIEMRIDEDQFTECNMTFKDVYDIKDAIVTNYTGIYHERLRYPKLKLARKKK